MKNRWKKFAIFLSSIGPGLYLVGYNIGTGSVTTMASAGAAYNMALAWAIFLSCVFTYILFVAFGRYTLITGETALLSYKKYFGKPVAIFVFLTIIFSEMVSSVGVMAIVADVIREWSRPLTSSGNGFNTIIISLVIVVLALFTLYQGKYGFIEKILTVFVTLMGISFILTAFMVIPDASTVIKGLIPSIPNETNAALIVTGMIGTTMGAVIFLTRSIVVKQKGWRAGDLKLEKRDSFVSALLMFVLSASVMAAAAGTLFPEGLKVNNAIDMIKLLEPLAGRFAISIFVAGIVCAGLSSLYPHYLLIPMLLSDYREEELNLQLPRNRAIMAFYASLGLIVPIFGGSPVFVMIASQAVTLLVSPLVLVLIQILLNRESLMGKYKISLSMNIVLGIITLFTIVMSVVGAFALQDSF